MPKAKTIDRLELTRKKFSHLNHSHDPHSDGIKQCPHCGSKSLRLDGGCMSCLSCGWSSCG